jgi:hypothetical protein
LKTVKLTCLEEHLGDIKQKMKKLYRQSFSIKEESFGCSRIWSKLVNSEYTLRYSEFGKLNIDEDKLVDASYWTVLLIGMIDLVSQCTYIINKRRPRGGE